MRNLFLKLLGLSLVATLVCTGLSACSQKNGQKNSPVAATVNGEEITEADIDFMMERTFKQQELVTIDESLRQKVLESLISSRAMQQSVKKEMNADEQDRIARSVKAYEEELFVKEYLQKHVTPEPVTAEMVQQYYDQHPEQFGSEEIRDFELLKAPSGLDDKQRDKLLKQIAAIRTAQNWPTSTKPWQQEFGLQYLQGRSKAGLLDKTIEQTLQRLKKGETSDVFYVEGQLHLVRVNNITTTSAKPIAEVSGEIRKKLAPLMLRNAVKKVSDDVRATAKIKIPTKKE
jgi:EpsD family peptidyl-prolyl cis-trans isomerase